MPSPITPSQICDSVPSPTSSICDRIKKVLVQLPARLCDFFTWMLTSSGALSLEFKQDIVGVSWVAGDTKWSYSANQPSGWILCDGRALLRATYPTLFQNIGTIYGIGDGINTFNIPNPAGRVPVAAGAGDGLSPRAIGQLIGSEEMTLEPDNIPPHQHRFGVEGQGLPGELALGRLRVGAGEEVTWQESAATVVFGRTYDNETDNLPVGVIQPGIVQYQYIFTGVIE